MSLSDRLAAAARARGEVVAVRRVDTDTMAPPAPEPEPVLDRRRLLAGPSKTVTAVAANPLAPPDGVCPTCGRTGEIGLVDLPGRTADWTCVACGTLWQVALPPAPES
jgi:hypothetical protein